MCLLAMWRMLLGARCGSAVPVPRATRPGREPAVGGFLRAEAELAWVNSTLLRERTAYSSSVDSLASNLGSLAIVALLCGAGGFAASYLMRPAYRAEAVVMPLRNVPSSFLGGIVGDAGLGNVLGMSGSVDKNEPIAVISSRNSLTKFIQDRNLVPLLCQTHAIRCRHSSANEALNQEHFLNSAIELFQDHILSVTENTITSTVRVSVTWFDRHAAAEWCNALIDLTNRTIQERAQATAALRIGYLEREYAATSIVQLQGVLNTLLVSEMTKQIDSATQPEYAWHVIDRATPPDDRYPARPLRFVVAVAAGLLGALLWIGVLQLRAVRRKAADSA
jgi:uncharacterized protein involved in exopolysaccharide biosynthesis